VSGTFSDGLYRVTMTHTARHHPHYQNTGNRHPYQGRFRSFPIQSDGHFLVVCRYAERNVLATALVAAAEDWRSILRRLLIRVPSASYDRRTDDRIAASKSRIDRLAFHGQDGEDALVDAAQRFAPDESLEGLYPQRELAQCQRSLGS